MFCGCDCHDADRRAAHRMRVARRVGRSILGTKTPGPFDGMAVERLPDGTIHKITYMSPSKSGS